MRKIALALTAVASIGFSSAAFAGPPCNIHVGGLCGSDYDGWMQQWRRSNPGHTIQPVSPGGYGLYPNGQRFYANQGGAVGIARGVVGGLIGGRRFGGGQQVVTYGQPQIQTYTVQGPRHIIGYDVTCTVTHADGRTEIRPGHCPG